MEPIDVRFRKNEKLKSKKHIEQLFKEGKSLSKYPLKLIYLKNGLPQEVAIKTGVAVPKKNVKSAVKRNRIKRLLRESYRRNKHGVFNNIEGDYTFLFLYLGKEIPQYTILEKKMLALFQKFITQVSHEKID